MISGIRWRTKIAKADFAKATREYPSVHLDDERWVAFFNTPGGHHVYGRILGDIYDQIKTDEEKARGVRTMGRRPARKAVSLDEVYSTIFPPNHSLEPFPEAFKKLLNGRSARAFAMKVPMDQGTLSKFMTGDRKPSMEMLEQIASAAKISPAYFTEYRAMYVASLIERVLTQHPNIGVGAHREVGRFRKGYEAVS